RDHHARARAGARIRHRLLITRSATDIDNRPPTTTTHDNHSHNNHSNHSNTAPTPRGFPVKQRTLRGLVAMLAVLGMVAAACGDDDDAAPSTTAPPENGTETTEPPDGEDDPAAAIGLDLDACPSNYDRTEGVTDTEILVGQSVPKTGPSAAFELLTAGM